MDFTTHCICLWDSWESQVDICKHRKILWNLKAAPALESHLVSVPMNVVLKEHLPVASNHTKFVHNSGKTVDHDSIPNRANRHLHHAVLSIFCKPEERRVFFWFNFSYTYCLIWNNKVNPKRLL